MITKRNNIFETNSSSVHAIVVSKTDKIDVDSLGTISIPKDPNAIYGWEEDTITSVSDKLSYLIAAVTGLANDDTKIDPLKTRLEGLLCELGVEAVEYSGIIDHCSGTREFVNYVLRDLDTFKRYLFSPNSYIVTGNDNGGSEEVYKTLEENSNSNDVIVFRKGN